MLHLRFLLLTLSWLIVVQCNLWLSDYCKINIKWAAFYFHDFEPTSHCSFSLAHVLHGEATKTNLKVFDLTRAGLEPTIYRTRGVNMSFSHALHALNYFVCVFGRIVCLVLPVSLNCTFVDCLFVFSNVYFQLGYPWKHSSWSEWQGQIEWPCMQTS
jgi:hypothetical protein